MGVGQPLPKFSHPFPKRRRLCTSQLRLIILLEMITNAFHNVVYPCVVVKRNHPHEYSSVPNLDIVKSNLICSKLSISAIYFRIFGPVIEHPRDPTSTTPSIPLRQREGLHQNSSDFAQQEMFHNKDVTTEVVEKGPRTVQVPLHNIAEVQHIEVALFTPKRTSLRALTEHQFRTPNAMASSDLEHILQRQKVLL
jgi:hypothetical protein